MQAHSATDEITFNSSLSSPSIKSPPPILSLFLFNTEDILTPINENEISGEVVDGSKNVTHSLQMPSNPSSVISYTSSVLTSHESDDSDYCQKSSPTSMCSFKSLELPPTIRRLRGKKSNKLSRTASEPSDKSKNNITRQLSSCVPSSNKSFKTSLVRRYENCLSSNSCSLVCFFFVCNVYNFIKY